MDTDGDGEALGRFWAAATGGRYDAPAREEAGEIVGRVVADRPGSGLAICPVPEPKTVKHRVHLDVYAASVESLLDLGATRAPGYGGDPWTVLLDPEGGELCAFLKEDELPDYRLMEVVVDARDPEHIARWWAEAFGVPVHNQGRPYWWLKEVPGMPFDALVFQPVPEPKTVKNRIHWDVYGDPGEALARGATLLAEHEGWSVLADPEGNEFCVVVEQLPA